MSTIREKPYIEELLASMSEQNLNDLKTILDSGGDNVNLSFATLTDSYKNKVTPVYFQFEDNGLKTGILIWTDTKCALICYHRFQDLIIFEFSPTYHTYTKIKQYCDINELRRVLDDTIEKKGDVDSGDAAEGSVPFADGEGGVTWDKPTEYIKGDDFEDAETTVKMIAIDDEGNLVKADLPEGTFVVDSALSNVSENPVQNKVITEELDKIKDGRTVVGKAQTAQALDNVSENSGSTQEDPFIFQGTGTNNNTSETPTSPKAHQLEKQGKTYAINNLIKNNNFENTSNLSGYNVSLSASNNELSVIYNASNGYWGSNAVSLITGHKYLIYFVCTQKNSSSTTVKIYNGGSLVNYSFMTYDVGVNAKIYTSTLTSNSIYFFIYGENGQTDKFRDFYIVDLTLWYNSNSLIPSYLLDHPKLFINYNNKKVFNNVGTLENSDGQYLVTIGFNQWDEEWELGGINSTTGENESSSTRIRSKNYIRVIPNAEYYLKGTNAFAYVMFYDSDKNYLGYITSTNGGNTVITTLNNATYLRFVTDTSYGTTYNNDICINLHWDGLRDGEYQPFIKHVYDTGTETLEEWDKKIANGTITRGGQNTTLEELNWSYDSTNDFFYTSDLSALKESGLYTLICNKYAYYDASNISADSDMQNAPDKCITTNGKLGTYVYIKDTSLLGDTSLLVGNLRYKLATPTTEQGTSFDEIIDVDDYGTMYWLDDNEDFVEVPQGCKLFYPADYALLIDDLGNYTNYDVTKLALKDDLTDYVKQVDLSNSITDVAGLTYNIKKLVKIGTVYTLTIIAVNNTGSDISSFSALVSLPTGAYSSSYHIKGICLINSNEIGKIAIRNTGSIVCLDKGLTNGEEINFTISYAIA